MIQKAETAEKSTKGEDLEVLLERGQEKVLEDLGEETIAQKKKKRLEEYYKEKQEEDQKVVRDKHMSQILERWQAEEKAKTHAPEKVKEVRALLQAKKEREEAARKRREEHLKALKAREEEETKKIKEMELVTAMLEKKDNDPQKMQDLEELVKKMKDDEEKQAERAEPDYIAPEAFDDEEEPRQEKQEAASQAQGEVQVQAAQPAAASTEAPLTMIPKELQEAQDEHTPKDLQITAEEDVRKLAKEALEKMSKEDEAEKYRSTQFSRLKRQNQQAKEDAFWNKAKDMFVKKGREDDEENEPEGSTDPTETTELAMAVRPNGKMDSEAAEAAYGTGYEMPEAPLTMKGIAAIDDEGITSDHGMKRSKKDRFGSSANGIGEEITRSGVARENLPLPDMPYEAQLGPVSTFDPEAFCNEDCQAGMEALFLLFIAAFTGAGLLARVKPIAEELLVQAGLAEPAPITPKSKVPNFQNNDFSFQPTAKFEIPRDALGNANTTVSQAVLEAKKRTEEELRKMKEEQEELARKVAELKRQEERAIAREQRAIQLCPASKIDDAEFEKEEEVLAPKKPEPKGADASTMALLGSEIDLMDAIMSMDDDDM